jgi:hypothetical protein
LGIGDEGTGPRRFRRGAEHQYGDVVVLIDLFQDLLGLLALANHLLGDDAVKALVVEFAAD